MTATTVASVAAGLVVCASMIGCSPSSPGSIVVTVAIEGGDGLVIPKNVNRLNLTLTGASGDAGKQRTLSYVLLGPGKPVQRGVSVIPVPAGPEGLPTVQLEIEVGAGASGPLTIDAVALLDDIPIVSRSVKQDFEYFKTNPPVLELRRSCVLRECPLGQTCHPGKGCKLLDGAVEGGAPPDAGDVADPSKPNGPSCACDGFFPFCVGAAWKYWVCQTTMNACDPVPKVSAVEDAIDIIHGGAPATGFLMSKFTSIENTRKWLTLTNGRLIWLKDEYFSPTWRFVQTRYFVPDKLRFDQSHLPGSEAWLLTYDEILLKEPDLVDPEVHTHEDSWSVLPLDDALRQRIVQHGFPKSALAGLEVRCHHRVDVVPGDPDGTRLGTYCFARHIGKIYELSTGTKGEEEWLSAADLPKEGSCISVPEAPL